MSLQAIKYASTSHKGAFEGLRKGRNDLACGSGTLLPPGSTRVGKLDKKRQREAMETLKRRCIGRRNSRFRTDFRNDVIGMIPR